GTLPSRVPPVVEEGMMRMPCSASIVGDTPRVSACAPNSVSVVECHRLLVACAGTSTGTGAETTGRETEQASDEVAGHRRRQSGAKNIDKPLAMLGNDVLSEAFQGHCHVTLP